MAHGFQRLANGCERRHAHRGHGNIIKSNDGALFGDFNAGLGERANGSQSGEVIESQQGGELAALLQQFFRQTESTLISGIRIELLWQLHGEGEVDFKIDGMSEFLNTFPAWTRIDQGFWAADESNFPVT